MAKPMPAIFFGHGNPMNALAQNAWTHGWAAMGAEIPRPRAVVSVSAHWYLPETRVTSMPARARFMISPGSHRRCEQLNTLRQATRILRPTSRAYLRLSQLPWTNDGVSITGLGLCYVTSSLKPTFQSYNLVSTKRKRLSFTMSWGNVSPACATRAS